MKVNVKKIEGSWNDGYSIDKHTSSSTYAGIDAYGHDKYDTIRTEAGEALYLLKYKSDQSKIKPIAQQLFDSLGNKFSSAGFIVPMTASNQRPIQPVTEIAKELARLMNIPCIENFLLKVGSTQQLKDLQSKEEKAEALISSFSYNDAALNNGKWDVLLIDDLYDTGASIEAACSAIRKSNKISKVFVATVTRKRQ